MSRHGRCARGRAHPPILGMGEQAGDYGRRRGRPSRATKRDEPCIHLSGNEPASGMKWISLLDREDMQNSDQSVDSVLVREKLVSGEVLFGGDPHFEGGEGDVDVAAQFVDAVETTAGDGIFIGHVVAVVGKFFSRREPRGFADDFFAFDDGAAAVVTFEHPFASEQGDGVFGTVTDRDEIDEGVGFVHGETATTVMVA